MHSQSQRLPRNFIIKFKSQCCSKNLKDLVTRFLQTTRGVYSAKLHEDGEMAAISGMVGPTKIITLLKQGLGLKATLFWEDSHALTLVDAKDIFRVFSLKRNKTSMTLKLKDVHDESSVEIDLKSVGGGVGIFGASSSCCGCFAIALVHVPVNRKMYSNDRHLVPPPAPPPWFGGYSPSAPPMETASRCSPALPHIFRPEMSGFFEE